jgi:hypothetical protein
MRTYTHGLVGYLIYARHDRRARWLAAAGGVLPDSLLAIGFVFHVAEAWTHFAAVASLHWLFHHSALHSVTIALHSFVFIVPFLILSRTHLRLVTPLAVGMLSHAVIDFLTHRTAGYNHLFPIPLSPVRSPLSYTDPVFTLVEHASVILALLWLWRRRP